MKKHILLLTFMLVFLISAGAATACPYYTAYVKLDDSLDFESLDGIYVFVEDEHPKPLTIDFYYQPKGAIPTGYGWLFMETNLGAFGFRCPGADADLGPGGLLSLRGEYPFDLGIKLFSREDSCCLYPYIYYHVDKKSNCDGTKSKYTVFGDPVPVPPSVSLLGSGLIGLIGIRGKRMRRS